jgi:hypothetical protein
VIGYKFEINKQISDQYFFKVLFTPSNHLLLILEVETQTCSDEGIFFYETRTPCSTTKATISFEILKLQYIMGTVFSRTVLLCV